MDNSEIRYFYNPKRNLLSAKDKLDEVAYIQYSNTNHIIKPSYIFCYNNTKVAISVIKIMSLIIGNGASYISPIRLIMGI